MATKRRKTTRKKRRTSKKGSGMKKVITLSGIRYTHQGCKTTESAAQKEVEKLRANGYTARRKGKCVYKGRKRKK